MARKQQEWQTAATSLSDTTSSLYEEVKRVISPEPMYYEPGHDKDVRKPIPIAKQPDTRSAADLEAIREARRIANGGKKRVHD